MPTYRAPNSDASRLAFMGRAVKTATLDSSYVDEVLLQELTDHYAAYNTAYEKTQAKLSGRITETAESEAALEKLKMYVSHLWTTVYNRAQRLDLAAGVLRHYELATDGARPTPSGREEWLQLAGRIINGDAEAVAAGFSPIVEPTAVELQAVLSSAIAESDDVPIADNAYDMAQANLATFRPRADELIEEVRDVVMFGTRRMDAPSQRRILRNYGAQFRYLPDEPVDEGDTEPVEA